MFSLIHQLLISDCLLFGSYEFFKIWNFIVAKMKHYGCRTYRNQSQTYQGIFCWLVSFQCAGNCNAVAYIEKDTQGFI